MARIFDWLSPCNGNSINDKVEILGAENSAMYSIPLDCDQVSGPDHELCENMQNIPLFYLCLAPEPDELLMEI